jgi:hypothetical protein
MKVYGHKLTSYASKDIKIAPKFVLRPEMPFNNYLINIVKILKREIPKSGKFPSFNVYLKRYMLIDQLVSFDDIFQSYEVVWACFFSHFPSANVVESIQPKVCTALRLNRISAVVLVVGHKKL